ncbi:MAG: L,D-transpeptidase family protein [Bacteroidetes bacterium]|nr:L,D-transpeptidase family protein [Bacteroidota bacterium]
MDIDKRIREIKSFSFFILSLFIITASVSCKSRKTRAAAQGKSHTSVSTTKFDEQDVADRLESLFAANVLPDSVWDKKKVFDVNAAVAKTYSEEEYFPVWLTENGDTSYVVKLKDELAELQNDGLNVERYKLNELNHLLAAYRNEKSPSTDAVLALDTLCTKSYIQASRDLLLGAVVPKYADSLWFHTNDSVWAPYKGLAAMGKGNGSYPSLDSFRSKIVTYKLLRELAAKYQALKKDSNYNAAKNAFANGNMSDSITYTIMYAELPAKSYFLDSADIHKVMMNAYQYYVGAKDHRKKDSITNAYLSNPIDSLLGRVATNMERLRWMQQNIEPRYVLVNVPLMELFFRIDGTDAMHMEVVVGRTIRQTPSLNANMANVVINPPWGVPPTIMKKDVLPGMAKSGKAYLKKKGLKVYDFKGKAVDASVVNNNNYKRYVFRQDPGDDNSLGYVKFNLPNKWDIYLHDTPHREDFGKRDRFQSSGCIRVQKPRELAEFILSGVENRYFTQETLDSIIKTKKTRYEVLKNKIPVHIVYLTAFEDSTQHIHFIPDVYKRDRKLQAMLQ